MPPKGTDAEVGFTSLTPMIPNRSLSTACIKGPHYDAAMTAPGVPSENDPAIERTSIEIIEASDTQVVASLVVTEDMVNRHGVCHGGLIFMLADTTMDYLTNAAEGTHFAAHAEIDYLRPAFPGQTLLATASMTDRWGRASLVDTVVLNQTTGETTAQFRGRTRSSAPRSGR